MQPTNLKILKICTHPFGGATVAARRQAMALNSIGAHCDLVSIHQDWEATNQIIHVTRTGHEISINVPAQVWCANDRTTLAYCRDNRTDISNTWVSFFPTVRMIDGTLLDICREYDVIHFHWISQMVSSSFLRELSKLKLRIVFTGHDMNHFTGGCHYSAGCERYQESCQDCLQLTNDPLNLIGNSFHEKISAFSALSCSWLFPSDWLADCFRSSLLEGNPDATLVIRNCIDTDKFNYLTGKSRQRVRSSFGFKKDESVLVAGTADNTEMRKGFHHISGAIDILAGQSEELMPSQNQVVVVSFGQGEPEFVSRSEQIRHVHLGSIDEEAVLSLFQSADLMLMSSTEENFANTILESLMCGCPVLAFPIGGVPDIVADDLNGSITKDVSTESLATSLLDLLDGDSLSRLKESTIEWRDEHAENYSYSHIGKRLLELYTDEHAVSEPRILEKPQSIERSNAVYSDIFGEGISHVENSDRLFAANLHRFVTATAKPGPRTDAADNINIPAIYHGFGSLSVHEGIGLAGWIGLRSAVYYINDHEVRPALCLQIPRAQASSLNLAQAYENLHAGLNGEDAQVRLIVGGSDSHSDYVWITPNVNSHTNGTIAPLNIQFSAPTISENIDPQGLCLRYSQCFLIDLNEIPYGELNDVPDHTMSSALALKSDHMHYVWENWPEPEHTRSALPKSIDTWIDLLEGNKGII